MRQPVILILLISVCSWAAMPASDTVTHSTGMVFKRIPAASFEMGFEGRPLSFVASGDAKKNGLYNEYPSHTVALDTFFMGINEVTIGQFKKFNPSVMARYGYWDPKSDTFPAYRISWYEADSFCRWMTENDSNGYRYRLPTEAEWEYCCRAGTTTWFGTGDTITAAQANITLGLQKVWAYPPNPWGLYNMHGNAREWCLDWVGPYPSGTVSNPAGLASGNQKSVRSMNDYLFWMRTTARGSLPPQTRHPAVGFRVVLSPGPVESLAVIAKDTLLPFQRRVSATRPAPLTLVSGETFTDAEGLEFKRVRLTTRNHPSQFDSVAYVSVLPVSGDSAQTRHLAGLYARRLSNTYGVLYRLSNRYELSEAGMAPASGQYHLTILPYIKYPGWNGHPDVNFYVWRKMPVVDTTLQFGGPLYYACNHAPQLWEAPNGDLVASWFSGVSEDHPERNTAVSRLRLGEDQWDTMASCVDLAGWQELGGFYSNGKGRLFNMVVGNYRGWATNSITFFRYSDDNGISWSQYNPIDRHRLLFSIYPWGGDSLLGVGMYTDSLQLSTDNGMTWAHYRGRHLGINKSLTVADNGDIRVFVRPGNGGGAIKNSDSVSVMAQYFSTDGGTAYTQTPTPFNQPGIGRYDLALKLHSGRFIMVTHAPGGGCVIAESEDMGQTWFCRRKFTDMMNGHKGLVQGRDGIIHLMSTYGSGGGHGDNPQASFSEQWLREGPCLPVSDWGINTAGMVATGCPDDDSLPPLTVQKTVVHKTQPAVSVFPNPFNPVTTIRYSLPAGVQAEYVIYTVSGKLIFSMKNMSGKGRFAWGDGGQPLASGLYLGRLKTDDGKIINQKLILVR